MLQPARRKFRKEQKGRNTGVATRGNSVAFGDFGLKSTDRGRLTARQLFGHAVDLIQHLAGLDFCNVVLGVALAVTHPHFCGLVGNRLVGEHTNPDTATALHVT